MTMQEWLAIAREPAVVRRALRIGLTVGTLLILINHGDALLHGELSPLRLGRMALTLLVPFCVSLVSSVSVLRELRPVAAAGHPAGAGDRPPPPNLSPE